MSPPKIIILLISFLFTGSITSSWGACYQARWVQLCSELGSKAEIDALMYKKEQTSFCTTVLINKNKFKKIQRVRCCHGLHLRLARCQ